MAFFVVLTLLIVITLAAPRYGADSRRLREPPSDH